MSIAFGVCLYHIWINLDSLYFDVWSKDDTQAYIQAHNLSRNAYVKPTPEFNFPEDH